MKPTGIVRRIDELGRIVIPKETRRTLKIREGTPLEIYCGEEGELILKKYSPIVELSAVANEIVESVYSILKKPTIIINLERVIASSGANKNYYINKTIDSRLQKLIEQRKSQIIFANEEFSSLFFDTNVKCFAISPIMESGDVYGAILILADNCNLGDEEKNITSVFADYLGKQIG